MAITFPAYLTLLNFLGGVSQGASIVCSAFLTLGQNGEPLFHLGFQLAGITFYARQDISRNIEWSSVNIRGTHLDIPKMLVRIDCTAPKTYAHFISYASQVSPHITHTCNKGVHNLQIFISGGIFGTARPSTILNALTPPPPPPHPTSSTLLPIFTVLQGDFFPRVSMKSL